MFSAQYTRSESPNSDINKIDDVNVSRWSQDFTVIFAAFRWYRRTWSLVSLVKRLWNLMAFSKVGAHDEDIAIPAHTATNLRNIFVDNYICWVYSHRVKYSPATGRSGQMCESELPGHGDITYIGGNWNRTYREVIQQILWVNCNPSKTPRFRIYDV